MNYPLELTFRFALTTQISATDSTGNLVFYVKQKAFKLKEDVTVYADEGQTRPIFHIKAEKMMALNAKYDFFDPQGNNVGAIKRQGMKSIWKARFDIFDGEAVAFHVSEENPWIKVFDALLSEVPILGIFTGYLFNPAYLISRPDGTVIMRLQKKPSFMTRHFTIEKKGEFNASEEARMLLGMIQTLLLERFRG